MMPTQETDPRMSDAAYDVALGVLRGFTMGEEVGSQALAVVESQNQALQERAERAERERDTTLEAVQAAWDDTTKAQDRIEELEAALQQIASLDKADRNQLLELVDACIIARNALSPTQETDPEMEKQFPDGDSESFR